MARMTGFVFQDEYLDRLKRLSDEELGRLIRALAGYHITGDAPELNGVEGLAFDFIRQDVDRIEEQYRLKCETNRRNRRGSAAPETPADEKERPLTVVPKDKVKEKDKDETRDDPPLPGDAQDALLNKARTALSGLTDTHLSALRSYRAQLGDPLVSYAIDRTVANGAKGWGYTEAILSAYAQQGIRTVEDAQAADEQHRAARKKPRERPGKTVLAQRYEQRDYHEEEMAKILDVDALFK